MAVGFNSIEFGVLVDSDGALPYPVPNENGLLTYAATVILDSQTDYLSLLALHSKTTVLAALGGGGTIVIERGVGRKILIIPQSNGAEATYYGILVSLSGLSRSYMEGYIFVECEWILVDATIV